MADKTVDERLDALEALVNSDPEKVVRELQTIVATGSARAQMYFGDCYTYGVGVPEDDKQAAEWYRKAAEQGDNEAKINLELIEERNGSTATAKFCTECGAALPAGAKFCANRGTKTG
jgi:TPR repeat protein